MAKTIQIIKHPSGEVLVPYLEVPDHVELSPVLIFKERKDLDVYEAPPNIYHIVYNTDGSSIVACVLDCPYPTISSQKIVWEGARALVARVTKILFGE